MAALIIEILCIYFQTSPAETYADEFRVIVVLLMAGTVILAGALLKRKKTVSSILVIIPVCIGLVGIGFSLLLHGTFVDLFFPRTSISAFLSVNFMAIAMFGVFLWIFRQLPQPDDE